MEKKDLKVKVIDLETGKLFDLVTDQIAEIDETGIDSVVIYNPGYGYCRQSIDKIRFLNTHLGETENTIKLTGAEMQSKQNRVKWAESLICQLDTEHEGRNSWLLNYGTQNEAKARREQKGIRFNEEYQAAEISPKEKKIAGEYKNAGAQEKKGNVKLCDFNEIPYGFDSWKQIWKLIKEEELKRDADIIEFRVAILNRSFFVTKKQIIDYTLQEMEKAEEKAKEKKFKSPFIPASEIFEAYIKNPLNCKCSIPFPNGGPFSNLKEEAGTFENPDNQKIKNLNRFEFESLLLSTLEKYFGSKFHK